MTWTIKERDLDGKKENDLDDFRRELMATINIQQQNNSDSFGQLRLIAYLHPTTISISTEEYFPIITCIRRAGEEQKCPHVERHGSEREN